MHLALGALAFTRLLGALTADAVAGGRTEVMAGIAPVLPGESSEGSVGAALTPFGALQLSEETWHLGLKYAPRLLWRAPNAVNDGRPLLLQSGALEHEALLGRSLTLTTEVQGSAGRVDYSMYALQATPGGSVSPAGTGAQPGQPQTTTPGTAAPSATTGQAGVAPSQLSLTVIDLYDVSADTKLQAHTDARTTLTLGASGGDNGPIGAASESYPRHTRAALEPSLRYQLSPTDNLRMPLSSEYHRVNGVTLVDDSAELEWEHRFLPQTTLLLAAGGLYAKPLDPAGNGTFFPSADASLSHALVYERGLRIQGTLDVALQPLLFVLDADFRPIASVQAAFDMIVPPRLRAGLRASFSTTATARPYTPGEVETYFVAEAPIVYDVSPNVSFECGARSIWSAPHLSESFQLENAQLWGYLAITAVLGTNDDPIEMTR